MTGEKLNLTDFIFPEIVFMEPLRMVDPPSWLGHVPFSFWLVDALRPKVIVELGTYSGNSFCAFCQAVEKLKIPTRCYAVDNWEGDEHSGHYEEDIFKDLSSFHDSSYGHFSKLIRSTFDEAVSLFENGSIDLLHIDGLHTYEAVKHDFLTWLPKISRQGIVLFHDSSETQEGFGVRNYWMELVTQYPSFNFDHCHGLGVLMVGQDANETMTGFRIMSEGNSLEANLFRNLFKSLGESILFHYVSTIQTEELKKRIEGERDLERKQINQSIDQLNKRIEQKEWELLLSTEMISSIEMDKTRINQENCALRSENDQLKLLKRELLFSKKRITRMEMDKDRIHQENCALRSGNDQLRGNITNEIDYKTKRFITLRRKANSLIYLLLSFVKHTGDKVRWSVDRSHVALRKEFQDIGQDILFDRNYYLSVYKDVQENGIDPLYHYVKFGWKEGRNPNALFWNNYYLQNNPDVAGSGENPLIHYLRFGDAENRPPNPLFHPKYYLTQLSENTPANALAHYLKTGAAEGKDPHFFFDTPYYLKTSSPMDDKRINPLAYYLSSGDSDYCSPHPLFDVEFYYQNYQDVEIAGVDPLVHYLTYGAHEGKWPNAIFDTALYRELYLASTNEISNPLEHFLTTGIYKGFCSKWGLIPKDLFLPFDIRDIPKDKVLKLLRTVAKSHAAPNSDETISEVKEAYKSISVEKLSAFLKQPDNIILPDKINPLVSIVIVTYNQAFISYACLASISQCGFKDAEVLIVDNASGDETGQLLEKIRGAHIIKLDKNCGFTSAVNLAASKASGQYLLLLNNDIILPRGSIESALSTIQEDDNIGIVGGKILSMDGRLQEAGAIIWRDGLTYGYGRGFNPERGEFNFRREVDYCSGAFYLVRKSLFDKLERFDPIFSPAYYEDTDFCYRLRAAGFKIVFDPRVVIRHLEFGSTNSAERAELINRNWEKFVNLHYGTLKKQCHHSHRNLIEARSVSSPKGNILVIDDRVPLTSMGSGYPRLRVILQEMANLGYFVTFYPIVSSNFEWTDVRKVVPQEVEVIQGPEREDLISFLKSRSGFYSTIFISRPHNIKKFNEVFVTHPTLFKNVNIIYDAEALFSNREIIQCKLQGKELSKNEQKELLDKEIDLTRFAGQIVSVSSCEAKTFEMNGCKNVNVLGHSLETRKTERTFSQRNNLLFVGPLFGGNITPNLDGLLWFAKDIFNKILKDENIKLWVIGRNESEKLKTISNPDIEFLGPLEDIESYYDQAKIFIAPIRFSAGIPLKILEAAAFGLPVVTTPLLAEQLGWQNEQDLLVGKNEEEFAGQCLRLLKDESLWQRLRENALLRIQKEYSPSAFRKDMSCILGLPGKDNTLEAKEKIEEQNNVQQETKEITVMTPPEPPIKESFEIWIKNKVEQDKNWFQRIEIFKNYFTPGWNDPLTEKMPYFGLPLDLTGQRVLDIGCNEGYFSFEAEKRGAREVIGIDSSPACLQRFNICKAALGSNACAYLTNVYDLNPRAFGTFDLVLFYGVFYHLRHPHLALEKILSVCTGTMIFQTLVDENPLVADECYARFYPKGLMSGPGKTIWDPTVFWAFNPKSCLGILEAVGFTDLKTISGPPHPYVVQCQSPNKAKGIAPDQNTAPWS